MCLRIHAVSYSLAQLLVFPQLFNPIYVAVHLNGKHIHCWCMHNVVQECGCLKLMHGLERHSFRFLN